MRISGPFSRSIGWPISSAMRRRSSASRSDSGTWLRSTTGSECGSGRGDHLHRTAAHLGERGAQDLVPPGNLVQGAAPAQECSAGPGRSTPGAACRSAAPAPGGRGTRGPPGSATRATRRRVESRTICRLASPSPSPGQGRLDPLGQRRDGRRLEHLAQRQRHRPPQARRPRGSGESPPASESPPSSKKLS